jgi:hypothetical protein
VWQKKCKKCGRKSAAEKVWQKKEKCGRKIAAGKVRQKKCGRKMQQKKCGRKIAAVDSRTKPRQQNATRRKKGMVLICVVLNL